MMKLILAVVICVFGTALCETHDQKIEYADRLINDIEDAAKDIQDLLQNYDESTDEGKNLILLHANSLNFNIHYVLDSLQYVVGRNEGQPPTLQEIVLKLNNITYELETSFKNGVKVVKTQLQSSVKNIVQEAKNLRKVIRENVTQFYTSTVLLFLDNLVTAIQRVVVRDQLRNKSKDELKFFIQLSRKILTKTLSTINSTDENVRDNIVRYSSKLSSEISETKTFLKDLTFAYKTKNYEEVQKIIYSLGNIVQNNEEVIYNKNSLKQISDQFRVTLEELAEQLDKIIDASYSDDRTIEDDNLIYIVLPQILAQGNQLQRNFERTIDNYVNPRVKL